MMADSLTTAKGHPRTEKYDGLGGYKFVLAIGSF
jgi:hypothetical protein